MTVQCAQINIPLKIPPYHTHCDHYSLAIKFNILGISKFRFFCPVLLEEAKGIYTNERLCINYACIMFLLYFTSDVNKNF